MVVDRLAFGGDAIGHAPDGRVVFVRNAAPGDRITAELVEVKQRFARGRIVEIAPGPDRAETRCDISAVCGGCPWLATPHATQLAVLEGHVKHSLRRAADPVPIEPIVTTPPELAWRSTTRLHWRDGVIGYKQPGSDAVVDVPACAVLRPPLPALYAAIRAHARAFTGEGTLRLTASPEAASGTAVIRSKGPVDPALLDTARGLLSSPSCHGVVVSDGGRERVLGDATNTLGGVVHPAQGFAQAHQAGNRALVAAVVDAIGGRRRVLELYAGSGNFTFALAAAGSTVTAMEIDQRAVDALNAEALRRGLGDRVQAVAASVAGRRGQGARLPRGHFEAVLLDPPRTGARAAVESLARWQLDRLVYVSCNPATLSRDLDTLVEHGWRLDRVQPFDLFPHTGHVEVLAVLSRT